MSPVVSVCIPTFNSERYIRGTLDCVLAQTFQDFEIIVSDNNSTDGTVEICHEYASRDPRVKVFKFDLNIGAFANFNRCIERASGKYIKFLMSDDLISEDCLEKMVRVLDANPKVSLVGCAQKDVAEDGSVVRINYVHDRTGERPGAEVIKELLLKMSNDIGAPTSTMMRLENCRDGFNRHYFYFGDFEIWCRQLQRGNYYFIREPLTILRLHGDTGSSVNMKTLLFVSDMLRLRDQFDGFMQQQGLPPEAWVQAVDDKIMSYVDYALLEGRLTVDEVKSYSKRMRNMVGHDFTDELLESMATVIYYAFNRVHKLNIEARWFKGQVSNLEREIDGMTHTMVWRLSEPLRRVRSMLPTAGTTQGIGK